MKYCLINCYSDNNKGDLGIILSTVHLLREYDRDAEFQAISTYNYSDPLFQSEHTILRRHLSVSPAIFGELNLGKRKDPISKAFRLLGDSFRFLMLYVFANECFLTSSEKTSFKKIQESDYVISKGGSFLCNENNIRTKLALIRFSFLFFAIFRLAPGKKVIILCQSLGPVYGRFSSFLLNKLLMKCDKIVLREEKCLARYPNIHVPPQKKLCLNDIAFHLPVERLSSPIINRDDGRIKIGVTMKTMLYGTNDAFQEMMTQSLEYVISQYGADVYIFPHVTIDDDIEASFRVFNRINDNYKEHIYFFTNNYSSGQLKSLYGQMDFMISSRLHSAIFSIGEGTPAIVIAYHGTKAQGIFANYEMERFVQIDYSSIELNKKIDDMVLEYKTICPLLLERVCNDHKAFIELFKHIFPSESCKGKNS